MDGTVDETEIEETTGTGNIHVRFSGEEEIEQLERFRDVKEEAGMTWKGVIKAGINEIEQFTD